MSQNKKITLLNYLESLPPQVDSFALAEEPVAEPGEGEVVVATEYLSIDAWIGTTLSAGWLHEQIPIGGTVPAVGVGKVIASNSEKFEVGDSVYGSLAAQTHALLSDNACQKIDPGLAPVQSHLGLLGPTTGLTAYFGIFDVGEIKEGETVVVSGAAGAVGSVVCQMAKITGCRVIGIAGGASKCDYLVDTLGCDAAIDYKSDDIDARLAELAPEGVDVFFDNIGGEMLDTVLNHIAERARVVICGAISQYGDNDNVYGPKRYLRLAERYARMEGFTAFHFIPRYAEAQKVIAGWMAEDKIHMPEQYEEGIENFPRALNMLYTGGNTGKMMVKLT